MTPTPRTAAVAQPRTRAGRDFLWRVIEQRQDIDPARGYILAIEAEAAPPDALLGNQHDLADTICFLDGHERPEAECHCGGCADFAESAVACLSARAAALAAPATLPADDTRIVWKRDHGMVIVTGDEEPQSLEIPAWAVRTIFDVAGKDPEEEARKVSAFINAHTGLDVERLARALQVTRHSTEVRDDQGRLVPFDEIDEQWQITKRHEAQRIAAAYAEQGDAGAEK